ncbi:MFS transporter [Streptomyces sp. NPDC093149]|uniref:MFS transporter n=1 Tax=Streptomyces sp. NPDC093149 TaxID=3366031 RepID=UPI0038216DF1
MVGTGIQYFDFFSYSLAAVLIFPDVFFSALQGSNALLVSLSTVGVAFVARPLGALIFRHFADRTGRKRSLVLSLFLMGFSTTLMGVLPSYAQAGWIAPMLLVILRIAQGIALGAEGMGGACSPSSTRHPHNGDSTPLSRGRVPPSGHWWPTPCSWRLPAC